MVIRLKDLDINLSQSSRRQEMAEIPAPVFEKYIEDGARQALDRTQQ
jgi:hypothetical protein